MNLSFLLEDTALAGKTRAALIYADALIERGDRVRIVTTGAPVTWRSSRAEWVYVDAFAQYDAADDDRVLVLADTPLPLVVDDELFQPRAAREHEPLRVLLGGAWHLERHGIADGYGAVAHARWFHQKVDLIRVSPWAPSREEPLEAVQEFHVGLTTAEMTRLMRSCDVLIAPNRREDTFALPAAEGLAAGLACVMTAIPLFGSFDERRDFALFAPEDNAVELGERLIELVSNWDLRERLRTRGREVAEQWRVEQALEKLLPR
ncbi:MAG: glycosyltransferase [Thermoanaerobaculia bacterium]